MRKKRLQSSGFSLMEMLVSVAIFSVLILIALSIFQYVVKGQRNAIATQSVQESMRFALEMISKELRSAIKSNDVCDGGTTFTNNKVYNTIIANDALYFKNKYGECVHYYLSGGQLMIDREGTALAITPDEVVISALRFSITDNVVNDFHSLQPTVTLRLHSEMANGHDKTPMDLQTTISSRYYE